MQVYCKARVVRAFEEGDNWRAVVSANDVEYHIARRVIITNCEGPKKHGGLRRTTIKMTVDVMCKIEEYMMRIAA
ncbi:Transposase [Phytophthora palmivora]|uniref:Transposase n=1 Tax=Phytophthora palmivora TaxID=4796 RepID=A0A2P4YI78_9STRA|nr:Transposase [Phytophthora palmivora]